MLTRGDSVVSKPSAKACATWAMWKVRTSPSSPDGPRARTIPIIMSLVNGPVGSGLVSSLARPGGNVTGISLMAPDLVGKQLEVLREMVPKVSRVALLRNPANPASAPHLREAEAAALALGVRLQTL